MSQEGKTPSRPNESPKNQQVAMVRLKDLEPDVGPRAKFAAVPDGVTAPAPGYNPFKGANPDGLQTVPDFATNDPRTAPKSDAGAGPM